MSATKTLPGPPCTVTGGAAVNNDCSHASDSALPAGQENELHDAASNKASRASQLIVFMLVSFQSRCLRRFGATVSSSKVFVANVTQKK